jgi:hypothetical protein
MQWPQLHQGGVGDEATVAVSVEGEEASDGEGGETVSESEGEEAR